MAAALSPDGRTLVIDLLGSLWTLPAAGGAAKRISDQFLDARQRVWAPDNRRIAFQGYAEGVWHLNVMNPDGSELRRVTDGPFDDREPSLSDRDRLEACRRQRRPHHRRAGSDVVMPGLIEMHAHLSKEYGEALGRIFLAYGITSVRNPAANAYGALEDKEAIGAGVRRGPRVFATGGPFDGSRIYYSGGVPLASGAQLPQELQKTVRLGYDLIKTYVRLDDRLQKQVIDFAHANGMPVTSHEIYPAVASGADGVEHIRGTSHRGYNPKVSALFHSYQDIVDLLTASKMTITPTIGITGGAFPLMLGRDPSRIDDARFETLFPASVVRAMRELVRQSKGYSAADFDAQAAVLKPMGDLVRKVVKGGGIVIAGTDSPIFPYALAFHTELEIFAQAGLTPFEVLQTATMRAAEALEEGANLGSIEAGKLADLVIVADDPLADVKNARKVRTVIENGEVHTVESLLRR